MASNELKQEIRSALDNSTLARTLGNFCKTYPAKRENAYAGVDFEATREKIKEANSRQTVRSGEVRFSMPTAPKRQWSGFGTW